MLNKKGFQSCPRCNGTGEEDSFRRSIIISENKVPLKWCACSIDDRCKYPENKYKCKIMTESHYPCGACKGSGTLSWIDNVFVSTPI